MVDDSAETPDDDKWIEWRLRGGRSGRSRLGSDEVPEEIQRMIARVDEAKERERTEPPAPPGLGSAAWVFGVALAIYLLISLVPRNNPPLLGVVALLIACPTAWVLTRERPPDSEPGPQRHTGLWAFVLLCLAGRALPALRHWDGFGVAVVVAAILAIGYVVVNRLRLRRWSPSWDGGLLGAAKRWAGVVDGPREAGPRRSAVSPGAATRLGLYLVVIFGLVGTLSATIANHAEFSLVTAVLVLGDFDTMQRSPGLRRWFIYLAGVTVAFFGPVLIARLVGVSVDRYSWWLVAAVPLTSALGIAVYVLLTHLPVRRGAVDSI